MKSVACALALVVSISGSLAQAAKCSVKTENGASWIVVNTADGDRLLTIKEVFRGMMDDESLKADLNNDVVSNWIDDGDGGFVKDPETGEDLALSFGSIPKDGKGDPRCPKFPNLTGLECRDKQLKGPKFDIKNGIDAEIYITVTESNKEFLKKIGRKVLACQGEDESTAQQTAPASAPAPAGAAPQVARPGGNARTGSGVR